MALLQRETQVRRGPLPLEIDGIAVEPGCWVLHNDAILLRGDHGIRLHYRRGEGVILDAPTDTDPRDIALWLNGTIYAAVAALNGLMPLHASAVAHSGRVFAFTGASGAGKSTLAAGLGRLGLPLFCDDTLILDVSDPAGIVCLPGHKRLKLWPEGMALAGAEVREQIGTSYPKHFAEPVAGSELEPLPLAQLVFLERGDAPAIVPVTGGERLARLQDDHYTTKLFEFAHALPREQRFAQLAGIAARIPMLRFVRPFVAERYDEGLAFIADHIRATAPQ